MHRNWLIPPALKSHVKQPTPYIEFLPEELRVLQVVKKTSALSGGQNL
jgi:hypothetical protein